MMLDDNTFEYTTTYKNPIIDIIKDININNNKFHIKNTKTNFYYYVEMFSKNDIIISTNFKITYQ
jgi:L-rhamnose mutarotase